MAGIVRLNTGERRKARAAEDAAAAHEAERAKRVRLAAIKAEEVFWKSPPGLALKAFERGDEFLQLELPHAGVRYNPLGPATGVAPAVHAGLTRPDILGQVEEAGWRLEHASWVPMPRRGVDPMPSCSSGEACPDVAGIYLFRRDETRRHRPTRVHSVPKD